jgi:5-methylcytosine-specific restriction protein B
MEGMQIERETLLEIVESRWDSDVPGRASNTDAAEQLERFADRAAHLNDAITDSSELGRAYQIGHTYFGDVTFFIGTWMKGRSNRPPSGTYLWKKSGQPQPPLTDLWDRSLRPLLEQYLSGTDMREDELDRLRAIFLSA